MDAEPTEGTGAAETEGAEGSEDTTDTEAEGGGEETSEEEAPEEKAKASTPPAPKRFKIKVDKAEEEHDEASLIRWAQLGRAKEKRFEDSAKKSKESEALLALLKTNTREALKKLGVDLHKFSEDYLADHLEDEKLTPEQKELREAKAQLKKVAAEKEEAAKKAQADELEKLTDSHAAQLDKELPPLMAAAGLPKSPKALARVAELWLINDKEGLDLPIETVVELAKEQYVADIQALFGAADGDTLLKLLGNDTAKKIRRADLQRLKKGLATTPAAKPTGKAKPKSPAQSREETLERIERLKAQASTD